MTGFTRKYKITAINKNINKPGTLAEVKVEVDAR